MTHCFHIIPPSPDPGYADASRDEEAITQSANKYGARLRHIANSVVTLYSKR